MVDIRSSWTSGVDNVLCGEVAQAHGGSLEFAHGFIDMAKALGIDAIKFQYRRALIESSFQERYRVEPRWRKNISRFEYWQENEFSISDWSELVDHAKQIGLAIGVSFFSPNLIDEVLGIDFDFIKIASPEFNDPEFVLLTMKKFDVPIIMSTGMSSNTYVESMVEQIHKEIGQLRDYILLQCTSKYPSSFSDVGLSYLKDLEALGVKTGLSYHGSSIWPLVYSMSKGASFLEFHLKFGEFQSGPDSESSLTPEQIRQLVEARAALFELTKSFDKDAMAGSLMDTINLFGKSVGVVSNLPKGYVLTREDLCPRRPGTGIPWHDRDRLIGKKLVKDWEFFNLLTENCLE